MTMIKRPLFLIVLICAVSACSIYRVNSEEVTTNFYVSKSDPSLVEYVENVIRPHEVIGFITVNTERRQGMEQVLGKMKKEAAILGGDALTNMTSNATGSWKKVPIQKLMGNAYIRANFTATVIGYTDLGAEE